MFRLNQSKLDGKIVEKGMTKEGLAREIGVDRSTFFRRLRSNTLRLKDIHAICEALSLTNEEAIEIFLAKQSQ